MDEQLRLKLKDVIKTSLENYIRNWSSSSYHPLDTLIPTERKIRSIVGGLETSMGTRVWEPIAKVLASNNGFEILAGKLKRPSPMPPLLQAKLDYLITARESKATWVNRTEVIRELKETVSSISDEDRASIEYVAPASGSGVDVFLKKDDKYYAFDTKTVQPNVGDIKKFNKQILEWYAYAIFREPNVDFSGQIVYPYNPWNTDFWDKDIHKNGALKPKEDALVEDEFWDFVSGLNDTFRQIMGIFEELEGESLGDELSKLIKTI